MKLNDYLKRENISQKKFADKLGIHQQSMYRIIHGINRPDYDNAKAIVEATNGEVTIEELCPPREKMKCPICGIKGPKKTILAKLQDFIKNLGKIVEE